MLNKYLFTINKGLLFACLSMYFGTGWSLLLFSFPIAPQLTTANYYNQFVPQVTAATDFFTGMTIVMIVCCLIFIIEKWRDLAIWYPIVILTGLIAATTLTIVFIFPYNDLMAKGITNSSVLQLVLRQWIFLNKIRVSIWTIQWLSMAIYYSRLLIKMEGRL